MVSTHMETLIVDKLKKYLELGLEQNTAALLVLAETVEKAGQSVTSALEIMDKSLEWISQK